MRSQEKSPACRRAPADEQLAAGEDGADGLRVVPRVVAVDQHAGDAVPDGGAQAADGGRHDRSAAGLGLERDQPEGLVVTRDDGDVGGPVVLGEPLGRLGREEGDDVGDAE